MSGRPWWGWMILGSVCACSGKSAPSLSSLTPAPLPSAQSEFEKDAGKGPRAQGSLSPEIGPALPKTATHIALDGDRVSLANQPLDLSKDADKARIRDLGTRAVLIVPSDDSYLLQAGALFALLNDAGAQVFLMRSGGTLGFPVKLKDEVAFARWIDQPKPGGIRIIQRADGLELQTNMGKVPGTDPNGPSLPVRGGKQDVVGLRRTLEKLKTRFPSAEDVCVLPSFGTELRQVVEMLSGLYRAPDDPIFNACLVYPRR